MEEGSNAKRLVFMDLLRAYAVLMMVQGHTIEVFLKTEYRTLDNYFYNVWNFNRGLTAPLFLFSTGLVFNFLFTKYDAKYFANPRLGKGIKRAVFLLCVSLVFRYPGLKFSKYSELTFDGWKQFLSVDILQLIAVALLIVLILNYIAGVLNKKYVPVFLVAAFIVLFSSRFVFGITYSDWFPVVIAAFINHNTGSPFPLFPWLFYVLCGAAFGTILHRYRSPGRLRKLIRYCLIGTSIIIPLSGVAEAILFYGFDISFLWVTPALDIFRMGFVLIAASLFIYISLVWINIPRVITWVGKNSLWVYLLHTIILYGSTYNQGLSAYYREKYDIPYSLYFAVLMLAAMVLFVYLKEQGTVLLKTAVAYINPKTN